MTRIVEPLSDRPESSNDSIPAIPHKLCHPPVSRYNIKLYFQGVRRAPEVNIKTIVIEFRLDGLKPESVNIEES